MDPEKELGNQTKRVTIGVLDFNWIFEKNNAESLIILLSEYGTGDLLVTKSFKMLIDFLWK